MDNNKGQTIFLSVIGIATLLVAIIGATFAWFSVNVTGNDQASSIIVTTATLGSIVFADGDTINLSNIRPEYSPIATKNFTITNSTSNLTASIIYSIYMNVTANDLSATVNETQSASGVTGDWFVHQIAPNTGASTLSGISLSGNNQDVLAFTGVSAITEAQFIAVPNVGTKIELTPNHRGIINGVATHAYTYTIKFMDSNSNQNAGQGKAFAGKLLVDVIQ